MPDQKRRIAQATKSERDAELCRTDIAYPVRGFALTYRAQAEAALGDRHAARVDFAQANQVLEQCLTDPLNYGTHVGAECDTQISTNVRALQNIEP